MKEVKNVYQRVLSIMSEIDYISKGDKTVNGQYTFVSHDQVTAKIHPLLVKHGLAVVPTVESMSQDGNRTIVNIIVNFINADNPTDFFSTRYIGYGIDGGGFDRDGREKPMGDKGPGKAISYAYKYALLKVFNLETGDDPDNDANSKYEPAKCLEFDQAISPMLDEKSLAKLDKFLNHSANAMKKHVEDVKREALKKMPEFVTALKNWNTKKKE